MMKSLYLLFITLILTLIFKSGAYAHDSTSTFSGEFNIEARSFLSEGEYGNTDKSDPSLSLKPEYSYSWDSDRKVFTFIPYYKYSELDVEKTHADIRELSFVSAWETIELRAGISKVFWGVTENQHLVDIVNQTDLVENIDFKEKLGQPMLNLTWVTEFGNFDGLILPLFRERTFPGTRGRFRGALVIDTKSPVYQDAKEDEHIDYALRWSHYVGGFEWALSYFKGTDREPILKLNNTSDKLNPYYRQVHQVGLELQYNYESWLFKLEAVRKNDHFEEIYHASTSGFEYTFSNIYQGADIGVIYELNIDERREISTFGLDNTSFIGSRVALNDEQSTDFLIGGILNNSDQSLISFRVEGSRRISDNWKGEIEINIINDPPEISFMKFVEEDDYLQFSLSYFY